MKKRFITNSSDAISVLFRTHTSIFTRRVVDYLTENLAEGLAVVLRREVRAKGARDLQTIYKTRDSSVNWTSWKSRLCSPDVTFNSNTDLGCE